MTSIDLHTTQPNSALIIYIIIFSFFFFLEVEALCIIYGNHTFPIVALFHLGVSKYCK